MTELKLLDESKTMIIETNGHGIDDIKDEILQYVYDNGNYSVIGSKNFLTRFGKCFDTMISSYPKILTFNEVLKSL